MKKIKIFNIKLKQGDYKREMQRGRKIANPIPLRAKEAIHIMNNKILLPPNDKRNVVSLVLGEKINT